MFSLYFKYFHQTIRKFQLEVMVKQKYVSIFQTKGMNENQQSKVKKMLDEDSKVYAEDHYKSPRLD